MYITIVAVAAVSAASASFCDTQGEWRVVWEDDFLGVTLNTSNWNVALGVNNSLGRDANLLAANVYVQNGTLILRSDVDHTGEFAWTSGAVTSASKAAWKTGRACVRAILPGGSAATASGIWPAHWMLPECLPSTTSLAQSSCCWPDLGDIDIMEMIDGDNNVHGTYHWSDKYPNVTCAGDLGNAAVTAAVSSSSWASEFHEFATEWDDTHVLFAFDGVVYANITNNSKSPGGSAPIFPQDAMYMLLNTAIGGPWPHPVDNSTVFPAYHVIDYVRVAQRLPARQTTNENTRVNSPA